MKKAGKHAGDRAPEGGSASPTSSPMRRRIKKTHHTKFSETVELAINLGVDPGTPIRWCAEPWCFPTDLASRSACWCSLAAINSARPPKPALVVGRDDMVAKIMEGWTDFDAVIATPEHDALSLASSARFSAARLDYPTPRPARLLRTSPSRRNQGWQSGISRR
jgi:large subunit ribosomal protein L1